MVVFSTFSKVCLSAHRMLNWDSNHIPRYFTALLTLLLIDLICNSNGITFHLFVSIKEYDLSEASCRLSLYNASSTVFVICRSSFLLLASLQRSLLALCFMAVPNALAGRTDCPKSRSQNRSLSYSADYVTSIILSSSTKLSCHC